MNIATKCWGVHVLGMDDLFATKSKAEAIKGAEKLNADIKIVFDNAVKEYGLENMDNYPRLKAVVVEWPDDPESHAECLDENLDWGRVYAD